MQVHQYSAGILTKPLQTQKIYWLIKYKFPMATSSLHELFTSSASTFFQNAVSHNGREKLPLKSGSYVLGLGAYNWLTFPVWARSTDLVLIIVETKLKMM